VSRPIVLADTETTAPVPGELWEIGVLEYGLPGDSSARVKYLYRVDPDRARADGGAMGVNGFYERTATMVEPLLSLPAARNLAGLDANAVHFWSDPAALALVLARLLAGKTLITSVLTFDVPFLSGFLAANGQVPGIWHFRTRDICSIAHGYLRGLGKPVPGLDAGTAEYAEALGVDPCMFRLHSALGDVLMMAAMLSVIDGSVR